MLPITAVNMSQYSWMKTVIIFLSAVPQKNTNYLHPPSLGKHAPFTQPILRQRKNRCKSVGNRDIALYCAWFVISRWMRFIMFSTRKKHGAHYMEFKAQFNLTRGRLRDRYGGGVPCSLKNSITLGR